MVWSFSLWFPFTEPIYKYTLVEPVKKKEKLNLSEVVVGGLLYGSDCPVIDAVVMVMTVK